MQPVFYTRSGSLRPFWWLTSIVLVAHFARNWWSTWSECAVGIKDRPTDTIKVKVISDTSAETLQGFVKENVQEGAKIYSDQARAYKGLKNHETVNHGRGEYVRGSVHVNGLESFWALLKRGYKGIYHSMSPKHLQRYANEFAARYNFRHLDTLEQMQLIVRRLVGKKLTYKELTK